MTRAKTPSFVAEFPLRATPADERALSVRLEAARHLYNAVLGEALRRLNLMRESKAWQAARALPAVVEGKPNPERSAAFRAVAHRFEFHSASLQKYGQTCRDACWIGHHLGGHDAQTTSLRAFRAVQQYGFGKRGRPRFKGKGRLGSIEGKEQCLIRYESNPAPSVHYQGLILPLILDGRDKDGWQETALHNRVKYVRLLRRDVRGKVRWYAQLILEGVPPTKGRRLAQGVVGLDLGPSTVAVVGQNDAFLEPLCPSIAQPWKAVRCVERAMDRSRRATNPGNFHPDGTIKKGPKRWVRSSRYERLRRKRRDLERRLASERKRSHGALANRILALGRTLKAERLSYRALQRSFGRSIKVRAPRELVQSLERKVKAAGGEFLEISTYKTRLSQFDHTTGGCIKKPLSQRMHTFGDRLTPPVQRDLYSAFLARCCSDAETLDVRQVKQAWPGAEPLLRRATSGGTQPASGEGLPFSHGVTPVRAGRPPKKQVHTPQGCGGVA